MSRFGAGGWLSLNFSKVLITMPFSKSKGNWEATSHGWHPCGSPDSYGNRQGHDMGWHENQVIELNGMLSPHFLRRSSFGKEILQQVNDRPRLDRHNLGQGLCCSGTYSTHLLGRIPHLLPTVWNQDTRQFLLRGQETILPRRVWDPDRVAGLNPTSWLLSD